MVTVDQVDARIWDQVYSRWWPLAPWLRMTVNSTCDWAIDTATLVLPYEHPAAGRLVGVRDGVPAPVTIEVNGVRWSGQATRVVARKDNSGHVWEVTCSSDTKHAHRMLARPPSQSAADEAETVQVGALGAVTGQLVSRAAARTGLPTYVHAGATGSDVEVRVRTEDTVAGVLADATAGAPDVVLNVGVLLPTDTAPEGTRLFQGSMERTWHRQVADQLWPHAPVGTIEDALPEVDPALPPFSWEGRGTITADGTPGEGEGVCWRPFQTRAEDAGYFQDGFTTGEGVRWCKRDQLDAAGYRARGLVEHVTEWTADAWQSGNDLTLLQQAVSRGLVSDPTGQVYARVRDVKALPGPIYAWREGVRWVVATADQFEGVLTDRQPLGDTHPQVPGILVDLAPVRDRRQIVFSSAPGGGLEGYAVTHNAPEGARLIAGGQLDEFALGQLGESRGDVTASMTTTEAASRGFRGEGYERVDVDVQPLATLKGSEVAFHQAGGKVDVSKIGPFFYREQYVSLDGSTSAPVWQMGRQWSQAQGSTTAELTTGAATSIVFGDDVIDEDGTVRLGWRPGDRVSFVDEGVRLSEVIVGYTLTADAGQPLTVTPTVGRADNGVLAELGNRLRGVESKTSRELVSPPSRLPAAEFDKRATARAEETVKPLTLDMEQVRKFLTGGDGTSMDIIAGLDAINEQLREHDQEQADGLLPAYLDLNTRLWEAQRTINRQNDEINQAQDRAAEADRKARDAQAALIGYEHFKNRGYFYIPTQSSGGVELGLGKLFGGKEYIFDFSAARGTPAGCRAVKKGPGPHGGAYIVLEEAGQWDVYARVRLNWGYAFSAEIVSLMVYMYTPDGREMIDISGFDHGDLTGSIQIQTSLVPPEPGCRVEIVLNTNADRLYGIFGGPAQSMLMVSQVSRSTRNPSNSMQW